MTGVGERPCAAMILAAGRGERMRPLSDTTPKPMLRVRDQPLIERNVNALVGSGIRRIVINLSWLGTQIRDYLGDGTRYGAVIHYSEEAPRALQPAGGIFRALPLLLPGPFVVVNGDVYSDFPLATLSLAPDKDAHLVLVPNPAGYGGDFGLKDGRAVAAETVPDSGLYTYAGIGVFRPALFAGCSEDSFPLKPLLLRAMSVSRCSAQLFDGKWVDVGTPERLEALNRAVGR
ncbi:MAG: N-acetyl-alpha-D-muramate 1-phosphate uridylyltransferase [Gammaproteobacteria bacterium]|jgi:MurNAc alpha-1-phosphate uridylyltransferase|nr:N-acetyl-alpha-D-muramate 1-phosphate uridylyltransferase [Gammaproteobacteria bacterium]